MNPLNGHDAQHPDATAQAQPQPVVPQPCAQSYQLHIAQGSDGKLWVALSLSAATGQWITFLEPDAASRLATGLADAAIEARSSLTVSRSGLHLPGQG